MRRASRRRRRSDAVLSGLAALAGAVILVAACGGDDVLSVHVDGLAEIEPDPAWAGIYAEAESCTGVDGDFARVTWYRAEAITDSLAGQQKSGAWLWPEDPHGIAIHRERLDRGGEPLRQTVRHESLHEVLQEADHRGQVWCECDGRDEFFAQC